KAASELRRQIFIVKPPLNSRSVICLRKSRRACLSNQSLIIHPPEMAALYIDFSTRQTFTVFPLIRNSSSSTT
ncbi:5795_t:CDS:2, partial [Funneliformis mosseae]